MRTRNTPKKAKLFRPNVGNLRVSTYVVHIQYWMWTHLFMRMWKSRTNEDDGDWYLNSINSQHEFWTACICNGQMAKCLPTYLIGDMRSTFHSPIILSGWLATLSDCCCRIDCWCCLCWCWCYYCCRRRCLAFLLSLMWTDLSISDTHLFIRCCLFSSAIQKHTRSTEHRAQYIYVGTQSGAMIHALGCCVVWRLY